MYYILLHIYKGILFTFIFFLGRVFFLIYIFLFFWSSSLQNLGLYHTLFFSLCFCITMNKAMILFLHFPIIHDCWMELIVLLIYLLLWFIFAFTNVLLLNCIVNIPATCSYTKLRNHFWSFWTQNWIYCKALNINEYIILQRQLIDLKNWGTLYNFKNLLHILEIILLHICNSYMNRWASALIITWQSV